MPFAHWYLPKVCQASAAFGSLPSRTHHRTSTCTTSALNGLRAWSRSGVPAIPAALKDNVTVIGTNDATIHAVLTIPTHLHEVRSVALRAPVCRLELHPFWGLPDEPFL